MDFFVDRGTYNRMQGSEVGDLMADYQERAQAILTPPESAPSPLDSIMSDFRQRAQGILQPAEPVPGPDDLDAIMSNFRRQAQQFAPPQNSTLPDTQAAAQEQTGQQPTDLSGVGRAIGGGIQTATDVGNVIGGQSGSVIADIAQRLRPDINVRANVPNPATAEQIDALKRDRATFLAQQTDMLTRAGLSPAEAATAAEDAAVKAYDARISELEGIRGGKGLAAGAPTNEQTLLGGGDYGQAVESGTRYMEQNPVGATVAGILSPASFPEKAIEGLRAAQGIGELGTGAALAFGGLKAGTRQIASETRLRPTGLFAGMSPEDIAYHDAANRQYYANVKREIPNAETLQAAVTELHAAPDLAAEVLARPDGEPAKQLTILRTGYVKAKSEYSQTTAILDAHAFANDVEEQALLAQQKMAGIRQVDILLRASQKGGTEAGRTLQALKIAVSEDQAQGWATMAQQNANVTKTVIDGIEKAKRNGRNLGPEDLTRLQNIVGTEERLLGQEAEQAAKMGTPPSAMPPRSGAVTPKETAQAMNTVKAVDKQTDLWRRYIDLNREAGEARLGVGTRDTATIEAERTAIRDQLYSALQDAEKARLAKEKVAVEMTPEELANVAKDRMAAGVRATWKRQIKEENSPFKESKFAGDIGQQIESDLMKGMAKGEQKSQVFIAKMSMALEKAISKELGAPEYVRTLVQTLRSGGSATEEAFNQADTQLANLLKMRPDLKDEVAKFREQIRKAEASNAFSQAADIRDMEARAVDAAARARIANIKQFIKDGGPLARADQALADLKAMDTRSAVRVREFRMQVASDRAARAVGGKEWDKLTPEVQDDLIATFMDPKLMQDDRALNKFVAQMARPDFLERLHASRIANMISGLPSLLVQPVNMVVVGGITQPAVTGITAVRQMITRPPVRQAELSMLGEHYATIASSFMAALKTAAQTLRTGISAKPIRELRGRGADVVWGGKVNPQNWVLRWFGANDDFGNALGTAVGQRVVARQIALREGRAVEEILHNAIDYPELTKKAGEYGHQLTLTDELTGASKLVQSLRTQEGAVGFGARLVIPFFQTLASMLKHGLNMTPYGFKAASTAIKEGDLIKAARLRSEATLGLGIGFAGYTMQRQGAIGVYGPSDPKERQDWLDQGGKVMWVKIGNTYHSWISPLGAVALPFAIGAMFGEIQDAFGTGMRVRKQGEGDVDQIARAGWEAAARGGTNILGFGANMIGMQGLNQMTAAMSSPESTSELTRFLGSTAGSYVWMGGFMNSVRQMTDQGVKDPQTLMQQLINYSRLPGLSQFVPNRISQLGQEMTTGQPPWMAVSPTRPMEAKPHPIYAEYQRLREAGQDVGIGHVGSEIEGVKLTPAESYAYQQLAGRITDKLLARLVANASYRSADPRVRADLLQSMRDEARTMARDMIEEQGGRDFLRREAVAAIGMGGQ